MNERLSPQDIQAIRRAFERVSEHGWGLALGVLMALGLFCATAILVIKGGVFVGAHLNLLGNYFPGYSVTWRGAFIGAMYAFVFGYLAGRMIGTLYNWIVERSPHEAR
jgi:hypothetical protein